MNSEDAIKADKAVVRQGLKLESGASLNRTCIQRIIKSVPIRTTRFFESRTVGILYL